MLTHARRDQRTGTPAPPRERPGAHQDEAPASALAQRQARANAGPHAHALAQLRAVVQRRRGGAEGGAVAQRIEFETEDEALVALRTLLAGEDPDQLLFPQVLEYLELAQQRHWDDLEDLAIAFVRRVEDEETDRVLGGRYGVSEVDEKPRAPRGARVEERTRLGFEVEMARTVRVSPEFLAIAEELVNETLASNDWVEFVLDDVKPKARTAQIEFRTLPFTREQLRNARELIAGVNASIAAFPIDALGKDPQAFLNALSEKGWTAKPALARILGGVRPEQKGMLKGANPQHATHSIPLAGFVKLSPEDKELLLPGSGKVESVPDLILFFYRKLQKQVKPERLSVMEQKKGKVPLNSIEVSTTGRNSLTPNVKTALDTLIGLLRPQDAQYVIERLGTLPERVQVSGGAGAPLGQVKPFGTLPQFPRMNPENGRGYLSGEEKLKEPLFDVSRGDVRVLIEHRGGGSGSLVGALNSATKGSQPELDRYLDALERLDQAKGDREVFGRWFEQ